MRMRMRMRRVVRRTMIDRRMFRTNSRYVLWSLLAVVHRLYALGIMMSGIGAHDKTDEMGAYIRVSLCRNVHHSIQGNDSEASNEYHY
jgi:hypothetical protein